MAWQDVRSFYEEQDDPPDAPVVRWQCPTPDCNTQTSEPAGVTPEPCDQCGAEFQVKPEPDEPEFGKCDCGHLEAFDDAHRCDGCGAVLCRACAERHQCQQEPPP